MKNTMLVGILIAVIVGAGCFWGGMAYAASKSPAARFAQGTGTFAGRIGVGGAGAARNNNSVFGTILSKDENGITVQLGGPGATSTNGTASGTRIVLVNASTQVIKMASGSSSDLTPGTPVTVGGSANSDGSLTAQSIQIRPSGAR